MQQVNAVIIGAGPAGAFAAIELAKAGFAVVLIDKAVFPRDKICGDALSGKVVEIIRETNPDWLKEMDVDNDFLPSYGVDFFAPNQQRLSLPFRNNIDKTKTPPGYICKRIFFDNFLIEKVKKMAAITFIENTVCRKYEKTKNGFIVFTDNGNFETKLVLAADGANSTFAKQFSTIKTETAHNSFGLRAYMKNVKGLSSDNFIELHFLKEFLPGYLWIFPLPNGIANVGVGMRADKMKANNINLKKSFEKIIKENPQLAERFAEATIEGDIKQWSLPLASKERTISGDNFMLLGDAAMLIDPFTGEGISNAMYSGYFAAATALAAIDKNEFSASFLKQYDQKVYHRLGPEFSVSYKMQQLVNFPWLFNYIVRKANKNKTLKDTIIAMFEDVDLREKFKKPSFYFSLIFGD